MSVLPAESAALADGISQTGSSFTHLEVASRDVIDSPGAAAGPVQHSVFGRGSRLRQGRR